MHPFLCEAISGFDQPSFKKCHEFLERLGQEYITDATDQIHHRDLLNLASSIFKVIQIDDTCLAFQLFERILSYLENGMYYRAMWHVATLMKESIPLGEDHQIEIAVYEFYQGVAFGGRGEGGNAGSCFERAVTCFRNSAEDRIELAAKYYSKLSVYFLLRGDLENYQECAENAVALKERCGFTDSIEYELDKMNECLASMLNNDSEEAEKIKNLNSIEDIEALLENSPLVLFKDKIEESEKAKVSCAELWSGFEKMESDELFDNDLAELLHKIKVGGQDKLLEDQEDLSMMDAFKLFVTTVGEQLKDK